MENQQQFQPQSSSGGGLWKVVVVIIILAALVAAGLFYFYDSSPKQQPEPDEDEELSITTEELGAAQIPEGFPKNIPMQEGNKVLQNYQATGSDGRKQSVRQFSTSLTEASALQTYTTFFTSLGWQRLSEGTLTSPVQMRYGKNTLMIRVNADANNSDTIVSLTLTQHSND